MTTKTQLDSHLDADQLSAFAEGALSAQERTLCLDHLTGCARCREIAFLAGAAALPLEELPAKPVRRFSFAWWPALSLTGGAAIAILVLTVVLHRTPAPTLQPIQVADATPSRPQPATALAPETVASMAPQKPTHLSKPSAHAVPRQNSTLAPTIDSNTLEDLPIANRSIRGAAEDQLAAAAPSGAPSAGAPAYALTPATPLIADSSARIATKSLQFRNRASGSAISSGFDGLAKISGTITDPTGAIIPSATILLDQPYGTAHRITVSDKAGHFTIGSLPPGKYRINISALGFEHSVREVELGVNQLAQLDSKLNVGSVSSTVAIDAINGAAMDTVTTEAATILTQPSHAQSSVSAGGTTLTIDASGKLLRQSSANKWKKVRGPWKSAKITALILTPDNHFKVTTSQASWTSSDGQHWLPAK